MLFHDRKGFTVAELLITLVFIGILTAIAMPVFASYLRVARVNAAAEEVRTALYRGKQLAVTINGIVCVAVEPTRYRYLQGGCGGIPWIGPGTDAAGFLRLQNNVTLGGATPVFTSLGTALPPTGFAGTISVTAPGGPAQTVTVTPGGRITRP